MARTYPVLLGGALLALTALGLASLSAAEPVSRPLKLEVRLPAHAVLEVNGIKMTTPGAVREFASPPVAVGNKYRYRLKATWRGKAVNRAVIVSHGQPNVVDLRNAWTTPTAPPSLSKSTFTLSVPPSLEVTAGKSAIFSVRIQREHFPKPVTLAVADLPRHVAAEVPEEVAANEASANVAVTAAPEAEPGTTTIQVRARSGSRERIASVRLTVVKPPPSPAGTFTLAVPTAVVLKSGQEKAVGIRIERKNFAGAVRLTFRDVPPGIRADDATIPADKDQASVLVAAGKEARPGDSVLTVEAKGGSLTRETMLRVTVEQSPPPPAAPVVKKTPKRSLQLDYPSAVSLEPGKSRLIEVSVRPQGFAAFDAAPEVRLEVSPAAKVTCKPWSAALKEDRSFFVRGFILRAAPDAAAGRHTITIRVTAGALESMGRMEITIARPKPGG